MASLNVFVSFLSGFGFFSDSGISVFVIPKGLGIDSANDQLVKGVSVHER